MTLSSTWRAAPLLVSLMLLAACMPSDAPIVVTAADVPQNAPVAASVQSAEQK